jgi:hypothetical protein
VDTASAASVTGTASSAIAYDSGPTMVAGDPSSVDMTG